MDQLEPSFRGIHVEYRARILESMTSPFFFTAAQIRSIYSIVMASVIIRAVYREVGSIEST
jgi:hypothetical protein